MRENSVLMTKTLPFPLPLVRSSKKKKYIWNDHPHSLAATPAAVLNSNMVEFTNNVEQLIRETDEAFQAVGFALGDAKAATRGWQQYDTRQSRTLGGKPINIAVARTNPISKRDLMKASQDSAPSSASSGKSPVPNSIVASKTKKSNSPKPKKHNYSPKSHRRTLPHPHTSARWHLGDVTASMADVFSGKMFSKIEVDEMLTPDRRQQLEEKAKRLDNERKASIGSILSDAARSSEGSRDADGSSSVDKSHELDGNQIFEADTISPTEPFHLENLLPRVDTSDDARTPTSAEPVSALSVPSDSLENIRQSSQKPLPNLPDSEDLEASAIEQAFEDLNFPSPPRNSSPHRPRSRSRSNAGLTTLLPTIPEVTQLQVKTSHTPTRSLSQDSEFSQDSATSSISDYIQLPSTPYTLTSPLFRHGPIRVEALCRSRRDSLNSPEEALDWTAFQMAISGTMDDGGFGFGADEESLQEADDAEVDTLLEWWASFGYQGTGSLVKEAPPSRRKKSRSDGSKEVSNLGTKEVANYRASKGLVPGVINTELTGTGNGLDYRGGLWVPQLRDQDYNYNSAQPREPGQLKPKPVQTPTQSHFPRSRDITPPPPPPSQQQQQLQPPQGPGARRDVVLKVDVPPTTAADDSDDDSLPPSPINLVKIKDEYIPMGYNLGHDLGDFLNWETYHVQSLFGEDEARGYM